MNSPALIATMNPSAANRAYLWYLLVTADTSFLFSSEKLEFTPIWKNYTPIILSYFNDKKSINFLEIHKKQIDRQVLI
jgi:hypothetical protein